MAHNISAKFSSSIVILLLLILTACDDANNSKVYNPAPEQNIDTTDTEINNNNNDNENNNGGIEESTTFFGIKQEDFYTKQGPNQCGATCFYMIFKYYKDYDFNGLISINSDCSGDSILTGISQIFTILYSDSWVSQWLGTAVDGITCSQFIEKITSLRICYQDETLPFYPVVEGTCDILTVDSDNPASSDNLEKIDRFNYIVDNYLANKIPLLIHLRRGAYYPGHWIVLTGYDSQKKEVYYMNPLKEDSDPIIATISYNSFILERWYTHADFYWYPDAYWDGNWIGFHH